MLKYLLSSSDVKFRPPYGKNIDFTDNLDHRQLYAQALHLFNTGERFWLEDDEIQTLIEENVPYQRTVDLV